ncbi:hypothetical protein O7632_24585 [Solwaraspora sp. WMMD406]|uniref:hypothetical protein n=1 Tax=Solwaraspora sp. WMMD406 TaxID=3016095 RepID=UPI0024180FBC|nr:hypothetical protein [Solwaraspora sp. WMMD406]MDG4767246.1 hypothetical protein [Solwaraspora sp. WMMD406]
MQKDGVRGAEGGEAVAVEAAWFPYPCLSSGVAGEGVRRDLGGVGRGELEDFVEGGDRPRQCRSGVALGSGLCERNAIRKKIRSLHRAHRARRLILRARVARHPVPTPSNPGKARDGKASVTLDNVAKLEYDNVGFAALNPQEQRWVIWNTICYNAPEICREYNRQQDAILDMIFLELTGIADTKACGQGSVSGCTWTGISFLGHVGRGVSTTKSTAKAVVIAGRLSARSDNYLDEEDFPKGVRRFETGLCLCNVV